jgi:hypothetical protein
VRLPEDDERLTVYGMTGSGKTVAALWHLSERDFTAMPWVVLDFKGDSHIAGIHAVPLPSGAKVPSEPGIYVARPIPETDEAWVDDLLYSIWHQGNTGLYVDEGYMIGAQSKPFNALLTQGRSKGIPMITLSQRPVWLSRFVVSEAEFHQVFFLSDSADRDIVQRFIPHDITERRLPRFHSWYYNVADNEFEGLKPVPKPSVIRERINADLETLKPVYLPAKPLYFI